MQQLHTGTFIQNYFHFNIHPCPGLKRKKQWKWSSSDILWRPQKFAPSSTHLTLLSMWCQKQNGRLAKIWLTHCYSTRFEKKKKTTTDKFDYVKILSYLTYIYIYRFFIFQMYNIGSIFQGCQLYVTNKFTCS